MTWLHNGYSSYKNFLNSSFSPKNITYGGPDFRGGSQVYTLAFTVVGPSVEPLLNFATALDNAAKASLDLFNTVAADIRSGFEKKVDKVLQKQLYPLEGLVKEEKPIVTVNDQALTVQQFRYYTQDPSGQKLQSTAADKTFTFTEETSENNTLTIKAAGNISGFLKFNYGTSYIVYLDTKDTSSDNIKFELLEKSSASEEKIDALSTISPLPTLTTILPVFQTKLLALKNERKIPLAVFVTKCSPLQSHYLEFVSGTGIKGNQAHGVIPLDAFGQATVQQPTADAPEFNRYLQLVKDVLSEGDTTPVGASSWVSARLSAVPPFTGALAFLQQLKTATQANKLSSEKGLAKQITDIIDAILKYIALISEFIRQLKVMTTIISHFFTALDSLRFMNVYTIMVIPGMGYLGSTDELKDILLSAKGLPQQEDLYYASFVSVFSVPTPDSISRQFTSAYNLPDGQPLPSYINEKARLFSKEMPSSAGPISDLFDLLRKNGLLK